MEDKIHQIQLEKIRTQLFSAKQLMHILRDQIVIRDKEIKELQAERDSLKQSVNNLERVAEVFGGKDDPRKPIDTRSSYT